MYTSHLHRNEVGACAFVFVLPWKQIETSRCVETSRGVNSQDRHNIRLGQLNSVGSFVTAMSSESVKVIVRCRPMNDREEKLNCQVCLYMFYVRSELVD